MNSRPRNRLAEHHFLCLLTGRSEVKLKIDLEISPEDAFADFNKRDIRELLLLGVEIPLKVHITILDRLRTETVENYISVGNSTEEQVRIQDSGRYENASDALYYSYMFWNAYLTEFKNEQVIVKNSAANTRNTEDGDELVNIVHSEVKHCSPGQSVVTEVTARHNKLDQGEVEMETQGDINSDSSLSTQALELVKVPWAEFLKAGLDD